MSYKNLKLTVLAASLTLSLVTTTSVYAEESKKSEEKKWSVNEPQGEFIDANIDVNQGTWMNIDVSPDGKTLVFDLLGDIYTLPMKGGEATALMTDIAWQMQPKYSPDGKHIAFTSDEDGGDN